MPISVFLLLSVVTGVYFNPFAEVSFRHAFARPPVNLTLLNGEVFTHSSCMLLGNGITAGIATTMDPIDGATVILYRLHCNGVDYVQEPIQLQDFPRDRESSCLDVLNNSNEAESEISHFIHHYCRGPTHALDAGSLKFMRALTDRTMLPELRSLESTDKAEFIAHVSAKYLGLRQSKRPQRTSRHDPNAADLSALDHSQWLQSCGIKDEADRDYHLLFFQRNGEVQLGSKLHTGAGNCCVPIRAQLSWHQYRVPGSHLDNPDWFNGITEERYVDLKTLGVHGLDMHLSFGGSGSTCSTRLCASVRLGFHIQRTDPGLWELISLRCGDGNVPTNNMHLANALIEAQSQRAEELFAKFGMVTLHRSVLNSGCLIMLPGMSGINIEKLCSAAGLPLTQRIHDV